MFYLSPPAIFVLEIIAYQISPSFFWSLVAYFAIYHFVFAIYHSDFPIYFFDFAVLAIAERLAIRIDWQLG